MEENVKTKKQIEEIFCKLLKVKSVDMVSKSYMVKTVLQLHTRNVNLLKELFCENPNHEAFKNIPDIELAEWRRERIRRASGK
jgi:hypothetical protein